MKQWKHLSSDTGSLWRRAIAIAIGVGVLATLVVIPELGLRQIQSTDQRAHELDILLAAANLASSEVHSLTPILRNHAQAPSPEANASVDASVRRARSAITALSGLLPLADEAGLRPQTSAYMEVATAYLDEVEIRRDLTVAGIPVLEQPNRTAFLQTQGDHEATYQALLNRIVSLNGASEARWQSAMTRARQLQALAIIVALLGAGAVIAYEWKRVGATFSIERSRAEAAERKAEHRGAIVNLASHELRNPLSVMSLSAQMMLETARTSGDTDMELAAADGLAAARRSEAIVAELLDLARLDADRLELDPRPVDLRAMVDQAIDLTTSHRGPRPVVVAGTLSRTVLADPGRLAIIVRNMVDNAYKYSPDGSPIEILVHDDPSGVAIDVADAGPGVAPEDRERVFNRYERLKPTRHIAGIGIGLHLSRELARRMGGELEFRDAERGARLRLVIPEHQAPPERSEVRKSA